MEVGNDIILSMGSLAHYHYYGDVPLVGGAPASNKKQPNAFKGTQDYLTVSAPEMLAFLQEILTPPSEEPDSARSSKNSATQKEDPDGIVYTGQPSSPMKKSSSSGFLSRRSSNGNKQDSASSDENLDAKTLKRPTEVMERLSQPEELDSWYTSNSSVLNGKKDKLRPPSREYLTFADFYQWAEGSLDDFSLDAIMNRLLSVGVLPSPVMEHELVKSRWLEWQETESLVWSHAAEHQGTLEQLANSVRQLLSVPDDENDNSVVTAKKPFRKAFGGIGGFDGRGPLGYGVMYCIDRRWWEAWEAYVGWTWAGESESAKPTERSRHRPGALSSESLLDRIDYEVVPGTFGSYEVMKQGMTKNSEYVLIPAGVWDILFELYSGGPPLPRIVKSPLKNGGITQGLLGVGASPKDATKLPPSPGLDSDAMSSSGQHDRVLRIPQHLQVETHPWTFHVHLCDPAQPYRRGDAGPMSIRVQATPDQPLWRLFAELVVRLPFSSYKSYSADGRGQARIWKRIEPTAQKDALARYGPWNLFCKGRQAILPVLNLEVELAEHYDKLRENWEAFGDHSSVESAGLVDGDQLMVECAIINRGGDFIWPREAAAKAGRVRRLADQDMKFRRMLRGIDEDGNPLEEPEDLVGLKLDAMDTSGRWYQVEVARVQTVLSETDEEEDSADEGDEGNTFENAKAESGEHKQVLVDFTDHGGHAEWIDVESDRLASVGRFTSGAEEESPAKGPGNGSNGADTKQKAQAQVKKAAADSSENGTLCTLPGYGACGLANMGNTCYINSPIQCMSYLPLVRSYLLSALYKALGDLNKDNPLGTGGKLLEEFAELLRTMWSGAIGEKTPTRFRMHLGKLQPQFAGADQQDAQEFLNYVLDALHEDCNRVIKKPYVEGLEDDWVVKNVLPRVGDEAWRRYLRRNRSIMADVAMGQVLNTVTCPKCGFSSRNFDPFNLLSLPFPTVADVTFQVFVVRRASAINTPWVLNRPRRGMKVKARFVQKDIDPTVKPPSDQYVVEQYVIAMSKLADSGDLKLQLQNLCGIPKEMLRLCRAEEVYLKDSDDPSIVHRQTKITPLTDKDGPCSQFARPRSASHEDVSTAQSKPSQIVAFEWTLRSRPIKTEDEDTSESNDDEGELKKSSNPTKKELSDLEREVALYGNKEECRLYDTETLNIAKAVSRSLWPSAESELKLGLRVDAIDHREHWFPGSVVEIVQSPTDSEDKKTAENGSKQSVTKVRIHFDNFSSKWDELYTIEQFQNGKVKPLYSHAPARLKPTEFVVHHRYTDRGTRLSNLFGQSFYIQCHNEWSTARAGAQILAQASRFLKQALENRPVDVDDAHEREAKIARLYDRTQLVISDLIDLLVDCDREYVQLSLGLKRDPHNPQSKGVERFRNPTFDASTLSSELVKRVSALLHRLPFEVRVCTVDSLLGGTNEEVAFPFSLMRTIGNYMNIRHSVVLQWREPPSDKKAPPGQKSNYLNAPVMYVPPEIGIDETSAELLENSKSKRNSTSGGGSGGLQLGVCLTEFCKVQNLSLSDNWRCPRCKDFREGKQNLDIWRLPDVLTFHIKRFNCSARWREKITTKVNFPLTGLDMAEWCHPESPVIQHDSRDSYIYDCIGVINHYGSMTGGHYVAVCKATSCGRDGQEETAYDFNGAGLIRPTVASTAVDTQTGRFFSKPKTEVNPNKQAAISTSKVAAESAEPLWLQFDDELVEPIPPRHVVSEMAYVLFYRRRRLTPSNIAKYSTLE